MPFMKVDIMAKMCRKLLIMAFLQDEMLLCIFLLFFLFTFFILSIISFGENTRKDKGCSWWALYKYICLILKKKKKEFKRKRKKHKQLFGNVITKDFCNLVYWNLFEARMYVFCLDICFFKFYFFIVFCRPRGVSNKTRINHASLIKR